MHIGNPFEDKLDKIKKDIPSAILLMQLDIENLQRQNAQLTGYVIALLDLIKKVNGLNIELDKKTFDILSKSHLDLLKTLASSTKKLTKILKEDNKQ